MQKGHEGVWNIHNFRIGIGDVKLFGLAGRGVGERGEVKILTIDADSTTKKQHKNAKENSTNYPFITSLV